MLWLYLHFPHLLLDHLARSQETPAAMVTVASTSQQVLQVCPLAQQQGVQAGMRLKTALALTPELGIVHTNSTREAELLEQQACWLYHYAAQIVLYPPDGLLLEASSLLRLYRTLPALWQTLENALASRRLTAWLACGITPKAARLLARQNLGQCSDDRTLLAAQVQELTLPATGLETRPLERLARLGLTRLGEVAALPPRELARRLAPETLAHIQQILGQRPDPQHCWQPPHRFQQRVDFMQEVEQAQGLLFPLQPLLTELEENLLWRQEDTDRLQLTLHHRDHSQQALSIRTAGPEHRASAFVELVRLHLERQPLPAPVIAMTLTVTRFLPRGTAIGRDLLGENEDPKEAWQTLIGRLQARLGRGALRRLEPQADHRPEKAWATAGLQPQRRKPPVTQSPPPPRPLWLLPAPQPLQQPPQTWLSGPERISSGWWDGERVQRDYYSALLTSGQLAWVYRDDQGHWFIHGWFG